MGSFTGIDVDLDFFFVVLREGDAYNVEIRSEDARWMPQVRVRDGVLAVSDSFGEASERRGRRGFLSRLGLRGDLFLGIGDIDVDIPTLEISYPAGARFDEVRLQTAAGSTEIENMEAASLSVDCDAGNLEIEDTTVADLNISLNAGKCEISEVKAENASVTMNAGSFSAEDFDCGGLRGDFNMGGVKAEGRLRGDVNIVNDMGNVYLRTDLPASEYAVDLDVALGNATVDGRTLSGANIQNDLGRSDSATYRIRVKAAMGNVKIDFD
jgi:hypothetical protein